MDNFINAKILKRLKIGGLRLHTPKTIWNIDGTHNKAGTITECVDLQVRVGERKEQMWFLITDLGEDEIVLGYPWLAAFQPKIDWKNAVLHESMQPLVIKTLEPELDKEVARIRTSWVSCAQDLAKPGEEIFVLKLDEEQTTQKNVHIYGDGHESLTKEGEDLGPDCPTPIPQVEEGLLRRR